MVSMSSITFSVLISLKDSFEIIQCLLSNKTVKVKENVETSFDEVKEL